MEGTETPPDIRGQRVSSGPPVVTRLDGEEKKLDEMCKGRINMAILSVSYFRDDKTDQWRVAVLLSTQFKINGKNFKSATVPLSVLRADVMFEEHYPTQKEYVKIGAQDKGRSRKIDLHPVVLQNEAGSVQFEKHSIEKDHPDLISLSASKDNTDVEDHLEWFYKGNKSFGDFPSPVNVLVIVTNGAATSVHDHPFPFELRLGWKIHVTVFGVIEYLTKPGDILINRLQEHPGWSFKINGPYNSDKADRAYESICLPNANEIPPVGLKHAMVPYIEALKQWNANVPQSPSAGG